MTYPQGKYVLGGHWTAPPPGWTVLTERDQDITKRLQFDDNSVEALFLEHVLEHVPFVGGVTFIADAYRVLKPGGVLRIVCPTLEGMREEPIQAYVDQSLRPRFLAEAAALKSIGLDLMTDPLPFLHHSMQKMHGHQFIWSSFLIRRVCEAVGFNTFEMHLGDSGRGAALERTVRGVPEGSVFGVYDPESGRAVEATK